jgi:hypothetical protein
MIRGIQGIALVFVATGLAIAPSAPAAPLMDWSQPLQVDPGSSSNFDQGSGVDCVGESFCVAVGSAGEALVSTDPQGGRIAWVEVQIGAAASDLKAISCPSSTFCAAVDDEGRVLTSSTPTVAATWPGATVDASHELVDISCSSSDFCAAIDDAGNVLVSDQPEGGAGAWEPGAVLADGELTAISCASPSLCAIVHNESLGAHDLLTSTDPLAGAGSWSEAGLDLGTSANDVSCPSDSFCAVAGGRGILVSTNPAAGVAAWSLFETDGYVNGISCSGAGFCAAEDYGGGVRTSTDPAGEDPTWTDTDISPNQVNLISGIDCGGPSFCAMVDQNGFVYISAQPDGEADAWTTVLSGAEGPELNSVSCPTSGFCAAAGTLGRLHTSHDPLDPASWVTASIAEGNVWDVSCASATWCVALAAGPALLYSTDPGGGAAAWSSVSRPAGSSVSCPSPSFCAILRGSDEVLTSTEPISGAAGWSATDLKLGDWRLGPTTLRTLSCPLAGLCVAAGDVGTVVASSNPQGGFTTWVRSFVGANDPYNNGAGPSVDGLDCTTSSFCVATTWAGTVATATAPTLGTSAWSLSGAPTSYFPGPVSCADDGSLCVAIDRDGRAISSRDPGQLTPSWGTLEQITDTETLDDVSCAADGALCAAADQDGQVIVGTPRAADEGQPAGSQPADPPSSHPAPAGLAPSPEAVRRKRPRRPRHHRCHGGQKKRAAARARCGRQA